MPELKPFEQRVRDRMQAIDSLLCVGLDPLVDRLPSSLPKSPESVLQFCQDIVEATVPYTAVYKPNLGFFAGLGRAGFNILFALRQSIPSDVPVLLDGKVNDMGETAGAWAHGLFDEFAFDALTVNPYMGEDAVAPYLRYADRGVFILCKTSNSGSGDIQDLSVNHGDPLYLHIAERAHVWGHRYPASVGLVVGATYPDQLAAIRERCPSELILLPGIGFQQGDIASSVTHGVDRDGFGLLCSASRAVMYADDSDAYASRAGDAARDLRDQINTYRLRPVGA